MRLCRAACGDPQAAFLRFCGAMSLYVETDVAAENGHSNSNIRWKCIL